MTERSRPPGKRATSSPEVDPNLPQDLQTTLQGRATFYLPPALVESLDDVWLDLRRTNRKLRKSDIVRIALEQTLQEYQNERENSKLLRGLDKGPTAGRKDMPSTVDELFYLRKRVK